MCLTKYINNSIRYKNFYFILKFSILLPYYKYTILLRHIQIPKQNY